jgi:AP-1-like factor
MSLQKISTENEILKATATHATHSPHSNSPGLPDTTGPMHFSPKDFYTEVLYAHDNKVPSHRIVVDEQSGSKLLGAGATWDYILASEPFQRGVVDIGAVAENLKKLAKCDGQGPVFEERSILAAIELSVASGSDELM